MLARQNRFICDCGLQYRLESDFLEHGRVGCKMKNSDRPTFSDKDVEELPAEVEHELVAEVVAEQAEEKPAEKPAEKPKKKGKV
jgi:hypothetical protein